MCGSYLCSMRTLASANGARSKPSLEPKHVCWPVCPHGALSYVLVRFSDCLVSFNAILSHDRFQVGIAVELRQKSLHRWRSEEEAQ